MASPAASGVRAVAAREELVYRRGHGSGHECGVHGPQHAPGSDVSGARYRRSTMGIVDDDIVAVRDATDIVAVITKYTQLRRSGQRWVGLCPFHGEKTPVVQREPGARPLPLLGLPGPRATSSPSSARWSTSTSSAPSSCSPAGPGITLRYSDKGEGESRKRRARLVEAMEQAVDWYHERLLSAPDAAVGPQVPARARPERRRGARLPHRLGARRVGRAGRRPSSLPDDVIRDTGLGYLNRNDRQTDAFRGRILFPIFDANGDAVGFGGRVMPGGEGPKYKNTPETSLYQKSKLLYALNWSKARIVERRPRHRVRGLHRRHRLRPGRRARRRRHVRHGARPNEHVQLLRRYARKLVLAFDADSAGQARRRALLPVGEGARPRGDASPTCPPGVDPADLASHRPGPARRHRSSARGAVPQVPRRPGAHGGRPRPPPRAGPARPKAAVDVIREHPSDLVRDQYVMEVAGAPRVAPEQLRDMLRRPPPPSRARRSRPATRRRSSWTHGRRGHASPTSATVPSSRCCATWSTTGTPSSRGSGTRSCSVSDLHAAAFRILMAHATVQEAIDAADPGVADLIGRLATEELQAEPFDAVVRLLTEWARQEVAELTLEVGSADDRRAAPEQHVADAWSSTGCTTRTPRSARQTSW